MPRRPAERGADGLLLDGGADGVRLRDGLLVGGLGVVELRLCDGVLDQELAQALEVEPGEGGTGLRGAQLRFLRGGVLLHEQIARLDRPAGREGDLSDLAGQFGRDGHALDRRERAHGREHGLPALPDGRRGGHRFRRGHHLLAVRDHAVDLQPLDAAEDRHDRHEGQNGQDQDSLFHRVR